MWQHFTARPYLNPESDLDLLWTAPDAAQLPRLLAALAAAPATPRLDGEIHLPGRGAVQWPELAATGPRDEIVLKTSTGVALARRAPLP